MRKYTKILKNAKKNEIFFWDGECGMRDAGCRMRDAGCRMQDAGCIVYKCLQRTERLVCNILNEWYVLSQKILFLKEVIQLVKLVFH